MAGVQTSTRLKCSISSFYWINKHSPLLFYEECKKGIVFYEYFIILQTLANYVSEDDLALGRIYPSLAEVKEVSLSIAIEVAKLAYDEGELFSLKKSAK